MVCEKLGVKRQEKEEMIEMKETKSSSDNIKDLEKKISEVKIDFMVEEKEPEKPKIEDKEPEKEQKPEEKSPEIEYETAWKCWKCYKIFSLDENCSNCRLSLQDWADESMEGLIV